MHKVTDGGVCPLLYLHAGGTRHALRMYGIIQKENIAPCTAQCKDVNKLLIGV
jgi:hypothetical protein